MRASVRKLTALILAVGTSLPAVGVNAQISDRSHLFKHLPQSDPAQVHVLSHRDGQNTGVAAVSNQPGPAVRVVASSSARCSTLRTQLDALRSRRSDVLGSRTWPTSQRQQIIVNFQNAQDQLTTLIGKECL